MRTCCRNAQVVILRLSRGGLERESNIYHSTTEDFGLMSGGMHPSLRDRLGLAQEIVDAIYGKVTGSATKKGVEGVMRVDR